MLAVIPKVAIQAVVRLLQNYAFENFLEQIVNKMVLEIHFVNTVVTRPTDGLTFTGFVAMFVEKGIKKLSLVHDQM